MDIMTKDGKDYLQTFVAKVSNGAIDATELFIDINNCIKAILKKYNNRYRTNFTYIDHHSYGSELQNIKNRFSGTYFSPSFLKSYQCNPALCLFSSFLEEGANDATAIGTTFHKILELYYSLPKEERERERIWDIAKQETPETMNKRKLNPYIRGFIDSGDYLGGELNDKLLNCDTEHKGRLNIYVNSLNYSLPLATSYIVDRIDYRDEGTFIIDYKTGKPKESAVTFNGYLGSMILYKWAMEQELNLEISGGYLLAPGNKEKYMKLDYSIENEKILIDQIEKFNYKFKKDTQRRVYEYTDLGYFTSEDSKKFREIMNDNSIFMAKLPVNIYLGEEKDRP